MTGDAPRFSAADVIEIASLLTVDDKTFVVGGQATNLWAWYFAGRHPALPADNPLTSKDIDYYGSAQAAQVLADAIGGEVIKPSRTHLNTPNTAVVIGRINGKTIQIDFMNGVLGLKTRELERGVSIIRFRADIDGENKAVDVPVMHPVLCLRSRIANMLSPATMRRDDLAFRQLRAAEGVVSAYVADTLASGELKEVSACLSDLFEYGRSDIYGREAKTTLGTDIAALLDEFVADDRLDPRYRSLTLAPMIRTLKEREEGRRRRRDVMQGQAEAVEDPAIARRTPMDRG